MKLSNYLENKVFSENLQYHIDNNINFFENVFMYGSDADLALLKEIREAIDSNLLKPKEDDIWFFTETDLGRFDYFESSLVPLDLPFQEAEYQGKDVELNSPKRGGTKKFYVYVKNDKGNVIKVSFGDPDMKVKNYDPKRAKSFLARHKCDEKKDKTTPGYWACHINRYYKKLGLKSPAQW